MRRRIALIAPPWYPVPPSGYGGTELVVALLAAELRRRGHDVVLFAAEGSPLAAHTPAPAAWSADLGGPAKRLRELTYASLVLQGLDGLGRCDVVHDHCGGAMLLGAALHAAAPVVHTVHGTTGEPERTFYASLPEEVGLLAISDAQRATAPSLGWRGRVHNAVDVDRLHVGGRGDREPYLVCLARVCADKGQHIAIEVARRLGMRLVLAGKIENTAAGCAYWEQCVAPYVDADRVVHIHNVAGEEKARLLAHATALLAPLQWEEPFGLALAEAMASGTPVIAFPRGAAPELVVPGVTGMLVVGVDAMVEAVRHAADIDPLRCAASARERFSPASMARGYLAAYERAIEGAVEPAPWEPAAQGALVQQLVAAGAER